MYRVLLFLLVIASFVLPAANAQTASSAAAVSAPPTNAPPAGGRKKRIAIFDFDYGTVATSTAALFGTQIDVGRGISDLLVRHLVQDGTYSIIERQAMSKILAEQNFSNSNRADANSAARIGKILGVDAIVVGSITQFGNDNTHQNVGGGGYGLGRFGIGGVGHSKSKAVVQVDARIVDIDTAEILGVASGKGESSRESTSLLGGGGGWRGGGGGAVDFGSSDFQQTIMGEAVNQAVVQMTSELVADAPKLSARTIKVEGVVAAIDGGQVVLNIGSKAGLKVGDQLTVKRITKEIKDPTTGQTLRKMTSDVGVIRLTDVDEVSAVGTPVSGSAFKVGDMVKTITQ